MLTGWSAVPLLTPVMVTTRGAAVRSSALPWVESASMVGVMSIVIMPPFSVDVCGLWRDDIHGNRAHVHWDVESGCLQLARDR